LLAIYITTITSGGTTAASPQKLSGRPVFKELSALALLNIQTQELTSLDSKTTPVFQLSSKQAIILRSSPYKRYQLRCKEDSSDALEFAAWKKNSSGLLFAPLGSFEKKQAVFGVPFGYSTIAVRPAKISLSHCRINEITLDLSNAEKKHEFISINSSSEAFTTHLNHKNYRVFQAHKKADEIYFTTIEPLVQESTITQEMRETIATLTSDWPSNLFFKEWLTTKRTMKYEGQEEQKEYQPNGVWNTTIQPGFISIHFQPLLDRPASSVELCCQLEIDKQKTPSICLLSGSIRDGQTPMGRPPKPLMTSSEQFIGLAVKFRMALSTPHAIKFRFNTPGWFSIQRVSPRRSWGYKFSKRQGLFLAAPQIPSGIEGNGPPIRRSELLPFAATQHEDWNTYSSQEKRYLADIFHQQTRWLALNGQQRNSISNTSTQYRFLPFSESMTRDFPGETKTSPTVWVPVDATDMLISPLNPVAGLFTLSLLLERHGDVGSFCRFSLGSQHYGGSLLNHLSKISLRLAGAQAQKLTPESPHCTLWALRSLHELYGTEKIRARLAHEYIRLLPAESRIFSIPGPQVPALLQLRILVDQIKPYQELPLLIKSGVDNQPLSFAPNQQPASPQGPTQHSFWISPNAREVEISNPSPQIIWMRLLLRAPISAESARSEETPLLEPEISKIQREIEHNALTPLLTKRIITLTDWLDSASRNGSDTCSSEGCCNIFSCLLARASLFSAVGEFRRAKNDTKLAESMAKGADALYRVWLYHQAIKAHSRAVPGIPEDLENWSRSTLLLPLPAENFPVLQHVSPYKPFKDLERSDWYQLAWQMWQKGRIEPETTPLENWFLLHSLAVHYQDWLLAASASEQLVIAMNAGDTLKLRWLLELSRATLSGQYIPLAERFRILPVLHELGKRFGEKIPNLVGPLSSLSAWKRTKLTNPAGFNVMVTKERPVITSPQEKLAEELWGDHWPEQSRLHLTSRTPRNYLTEIFTPHQAEIRLQTRWQSKAGKARDTSACALQVFRGATQILNVKIPDSPLSREQDLSAPIKLAPGMNRLALGLSCSDSLSRVQTRVRLVSNKPLHQSPLIDESLAPFKYVLPLTPVQAWDMIPAGQTARFDILGPNLVKMVSESSYSKPKATAKISAFATNGQKSTQTLFTYSNHTAETIHLPLENEQTWQVNIQAVSPLRLRVFHRKTRNRLFSEGEEIIKPLFWGRDTQNSLPQNQISLPPYLKFSRYAEPRGNKGTLWLGGIVMTDSPEASEALEKPESWIMGPRFGWHSQAIRKKLWYRIDTELRDRAVGHTGLYSRLSAVIQSGFQLRFLPTLSLALQNLDENMEYSIRSALRTEYSWQLSDTLRFISGCRIHYYFFTLEKAPYIPPEEVDRYIFSSYSADHYRGVSPQLQLLFRPFNSLLLKNSITVKSNSDFFTPDRVDLGFSAFQAFAGLVLHSNASLHYRWQDDQRTKALVESDLGFWINSNFWLSSDKSLFIKTGGRYILDQSYFDLSLFLGVVWNFNRGFTDESSAWLPLKSFLETKRPQSVFLERITKND